MQLFGNYNFETLVQVFQGNFLGRETSEDKKKNEIILEYYNLRLVINTADKTAKLYRISNRDGRRVLEPLMKFTGEKL